METANAISGIQNLNTNMMKRSAAAQVSVETPPPGLPASTGQTQAVVAASNTEKSNLSGNNADQDKEQLAAAVKNVNDFFQMVRRTLQFTVDEDTGRMVIQIKDAETDKVIRQIPPENMLKLAKELGKFKGLLLEEKA